MTIDLHGGRLGVLAGAGTLPDQIFNQCRAAEIDFYAVYFKGQCEEAPAEDVKHDIVKLGQVQKTINLLKQNGCTHIVFAGSVKRPSFFDIRPDLRAAGLVAKMGLGAVGDDRLLRAIKAELEKEGFLILGAHDILPHILTPEGVLTRTAPDERDWADIKAGYDILQKLGEADIGQACILQHGLVLGLEAIEGTDALIMRAGLHKRGGGGGVLVKRSKPGQDESLDIPTIGEMTVRHMRESGLKGIALEAHRSQILNETEAISAANAAGIFILGFTEEDLKHV